MALKKALAYATAALCALAATAGWASPGDSVKVGTLTEPATFVDSQTGESYSFFLRAGEGGGGIGNATVGLDGVTRACSTHGPGIELVNNGDHFDGNNPLTAIQCGTAAGQSVTINGCTVDIELHGYVHSDHPNTSFMGPTTLDVRYQKSQGGDQVKIIVYTPKAPMVLNGKLASSFVEMPSCP